MQKYQAKILYYSYVYNNSNFYENPKPRYEYYFFNSSSLDEAYKEVTKHIKKNRSNFFSSISLDYILELGIPYTDINFTQSSQPSS